MKYQINYKAQYPIRLLYGFLKANGYEYQLPTAYPAKTDWGELIPNEKFKFDKGERVEIEVGWLALLTRKTYYFRCPLDLSKEIMESDCFTLIIGLGDHGEVAIWLFNELKNTLILYTHGIDITEKVTDEMIERANILDNNGEKIHTIKELCNNDLKLFKTVLLEKTSTNKSIENRMKRFSFRYCTEFATLPLEYRIAESQYDGSFDKAQIENIYQYRSASKPRHLQISWILEESSNDRDDYNALFWMDEEEITAIFDRFYGAHPETKADFIIRIDPENRKYELALYRQGLKEPVIIPQSAYQLIVFKNKFEDYRSENYDQPRGAWIW